MKAGITEEEECPYSQRKKRSEKVRLTGVFLFFFPTFLCPSGVCHSLCGVHGYSRKCSLFPGCFFTLYYFLADLCLCFVE